MITLIKPHPEIGLEVSNDYYFPIQIETKFDFMIEVLNDLSDFIQRGSLGRQQYGFNLLCLKDRKILSIPLKLVEVYKKC